MTAHGTVRRMTDGQKSDIIATITGVIPSDLSFDEAQTIIGAKGPFVAEIREVFKRRRIQSGLLELIGTIVIPATSMPFVVREKFVVGNAQAKISWLGENFTTWFLEKIEEPVVETTLRYAKLITSSVDGPILTELGDEKAETTLTQIFALIERQAKGEEGVLLTNGWANIFYIRDVNGELRAVRVGWGGGDWGVDAGSVEDPDGWGGGRRVFSRNS
ncbi:MAG: hypothetical protein Q7S63_01420 [bacterium]|nr:hypothetical protein [bacterium]